MDTTFYIHSHNEMEQTLHGGKQIFFFYRHNKTSKQIEEKNTAS